MTTPRWEGIPAAAAESSRGGGRAPLKRGAAGRRWSGDRARGEAPRSRGAERAPAARPGYLPGGSFARSRNGFTRSMGSGNTTVEFFSAEISTSVWR